MSFVYQHPYEKDQVTVSLNPIVDGQFLFSVPFELPLVYDAHKVTLIKDELRTVLEEKSKAFRYYLNEAEDLITMLYAEQKFQHSEPAP